MCPQETKKPLYWVRSCRKEIGKFPKEVQERVALDLEQVQQGTTPQRAKPLSGFRGVWEIVTNYDKNTYRTIYTVELKGIIFVLHAFQKKAKRGTKTPRKEIKLVRDRMIAARELYDKYSMEK